MTSDIAIAESASRRDGGVFQRCDAPSALQATSEAWLSNRRSLIRGAGSFAEVLGFAGRRPQAFPDKLARLAMLVRVAGPKLIGARLIASVLAELGKGWRDCVPSVSSATLSERVCLVITAAGSNGRTT
jgi:hypothetical protein